MNESMTRRTAMGRMAGAAAGTLATMRQRLLEWRTTAGDTQPKV